MYVSNILIVLQNGLDLTSVGGAGGDEQHRAKHNAICICVKALHTLDAQLLAARLNKMLERSNMEKKGEGGTLSHNFRVNPSSAGVTVEHSRKKKGGNFLVHSSPFYSTKGIEAMGCCHPYAGQELSLQAVLSVNSFTDSERHFTNHVHISQFNQLDNIDHHGVQGLQDM